MVKKNYVKDQVQDDARPGEVFVKVYVDGKDETDKDIKYFLKRERVIVARLEEEITREEARLAVDMARETARIDEMKAKLALVKGE